jgi:hypothetical protein
MGGDAVVDGAVLAVVAAGVGGACAASALPAIVARNRAARGRARRTVSMAHTVADARDAGPRNRAIARLPEARFRPLSRYAAAEVAVATGAPSSRQFIRG